MGGREESRTEIEQYEFDRQGYLVIEGMLTPREVTVLSAAVVDELEEHADKTWCWRDWTALRIARRAGAHQLDAAVAVGEFLRRK